MTEKAALRGPAWRAAIDLSGPCGAYAAMAPNGDIAFSRQLPRKGMDHADFFKALFDDFSRLDASLATVKEWIVGSGPGSFTGTRAAAALVAGLTFGKPDVAAYGLPSALPVLAATAPQIGETLVALFDGRRGELIAYAAQATPQAIKPFPEALFLVGGERGFDALEKFDKLVTADPEIVRSVLPAPFRSRLIAVEGFPIDHALSPALAAAKTDIADVLYARPAVFVPPTPTRQAL